MFRGNTRHICSSFRALNPAVMPVHYAFFRAYNHEYCRDGGRQDGRGRGPGRGPGRGRGRLLMTSYNTRIRGYTITNQ